MRNSLPKVLHPLAGLPLIGHVLATARQVEAETIVIVLAPDMDAVAELVEKSGSEVRVVIQDPPLGTGHAVQCAQPELPQDGIVLVLYGDTPLIRSETLKALVDRLDADDAAVAVLGMRPPDPSGYGRLRFDSAGALIELVEERHADAELKKSGLCNSGVMAVAASKLSELLSAMPIRVEKNEYYLTDIVRLATERGWRCTATEGDWVDGVGVNSQVQLAEASTLLQERLRHRSLEHGVIMPAPETVQLAADTVIGPGATIEAYVVFGPGVSVATGATVRSFSHLEGVRIEASAVVGPFARLRPNTHVQAGARVGNFVELKNTALGEYAKANHLSYLGDCEIGEHANIGAGTITCNYDGFAKHRTRIGAGAFIGSNSALVAPIEVGEHAIVGAGSTLTENVPDQALAIARERQQTFEARAPQIRNRLNGGKDSDPS